MLIKIANAVKGLKENNCKDKPETLTLLRAPEVLVYYQKCSVVGQQVAMKTDKTIDFIIYHCFWSRLKKLSIVSLLFKTGYIASF